MCGILKKMVSEIRICSPDFFFQGASTSEVRKTHSPENFNLWPQVPQILGSYENKVLGIRPRDDTSCVSRNLSLLRLSKSYVKKSQPIIHLHDCCFLSFFAPAATERIY